MALVKKSPGSGESPVAFIGNGPVTSNLAEEIAAKREVTRVQMRRIPSKQEIPHLERIIEAHPDVQLRLYGLHRLPPDADLTPLGELSTLRNLLIDWELADLEFLEGMRALVVLATAVRGKSTNLRPLSACSELRHLSLGGTLKSLEPLTALTSLRSLTIAPKKADLKPLLHLPTLESLGFDGGSVLSYEPVASMEHLRRLSLSNQRVAAEDLTPLARSTSLAALSLQYMPKLTHLDFLAGAPQLGALELVTLSRLESITQLPTLPLWALAFSVVGKLKSDAIDDLLACEGIELAVIAPKLFTQLGRMDAHEELQARSKQRGLDWRSWRDLVANRIGIEVPPGPR
jgi:hypothetical protein